MSNDNTKTVIKSINFDDTLISKNIKDGYYEIVKGGVTIRVANNDNYEMEFLGEDLKTLGILK